MGVEGVAGDYEANNLVPFDATVTSERWEHPSQAPLVLLCNGFSAGFMTRFLATHCVLNPPSGLAWEVGLEAGADAAVAGRGADTPASIKALGHSALWGRGHEWGAPVSGQVRRPLRFFQR